MSAGNVPSGRSGASGGVASGGIGSYNPIQYAAEALLQLEPALGVAGMIYRGLDQDPKSRGSQIQIRRPGVFQATEMPIASAEDIDTENVIVDLNQWWGTRFAPRDDELSFSGDRLIEEHIRPSAVSIADKIDRTVLGLYVDVPNIYECETGSGAIKDFSGVRRVMFENKVPQMGKRILAVNGERETEYLSLDTFVRANESADGGETQRAGSLGRKFGYDIVVVQNIQEHTRGTAAQGSNNEGDLNGAHAKGTTTLAVTDFSGTETVKRGDTLKVAGSSRRYVITEDLAFTGGAGSLKIAPGLDVAGADDAAVTLDKQTSGKGGAAQNIALHEDAFALAMAPLSDKAHGSGAMIGYSADPLTRLSLRSRMWYDGDTARLNVSLDALWGVKVLTADMAVRAQSSA